MTLEWHSTLSKCSHLSTKWLAPKIEKSFYEKLRNLQLTIMTSQPLCVLPNQCHRVFSDLHQPLKLLRKILRTKISLTNNVSDDLAIETLKTSLIYRYQNQASRPLETNPMYHRLIYNISISKTQNIRSGIKHLAVYRTVISMQCNQWQPSHHFQRVARSSL